MGLGREETLPHITHDTESQTDTQFFDTESTETVVDAECPVSVSYCYTPHLYLQFK